MIGTEKMSSLGLVRLLSTTLSPQTGRLFLGIICVLASQASVCQVGTGYVSSLEATEAEVLKAMDLAVNDPIVYGTYSYEKDRQLKGAIQADSAPVFGKVQDGGKVFFKVAENVLAPRHFKESADLGTIYVRYIVRGTGSGTTAIQIDAIYVEKNRRRQHRSDGTVEKSEFQAIRDRLQEIRAEAKPPFLDKGGEVASSAIGIGNPSAWASKGASTQEELEKQVAELKHRAEMRTAAGGAALKAAPYRTAATLQPLPAQAELLVVVLTKYWYGVETTDGHRGWVHRSQMEPLP